MASAIEYVGLSQINGPLAVIEGVKGAANEEMVELTTSSGERRLGQIIRIDGDRAVIQVYEDTADLSLSNTRTRFSGRSMEIPLSEEMLGRVFDGSGRPIDGLGNVYPEKMGDINGNPMNPIMREYPRNFIETGISAIDGLATLIIGQKLPIFSGNGMPHDRLAAQIVRQAKL
ncbi:MAG: V-type ATP synthase subunit B, partial [Clostridia bacterium]